jgi:hypothetical protein
MLILAAMLFVYFGYFPHVTPADAAVEEAKKVADKAPTGQEHVIIQYEPRYKDAYERHNGHARHSLLKPR